MSSNQSGEGEIRKAMLEADVEDCMVALPGQLFYSTQIPACLWFLARNKNPGNTCATVAAKYCSSTPATWACWCGPHPARTQRHPCLGAAELHLRNLMPKGLTQDELQARPDYSHEVLAASLP
jgi:hypothetical protein